jgi:DNA-binding NarL/FixJ family response regulator
MPLTVARELVARAAVSSGAPSIPDRVAALTPRQREILLLVAEGLTNKAIAARLVLDVKTVKSHVHAILARLQVSTRGEAAALLTGVSAGSGEGT